MTNKIAVPRHRIPKLTAVCPICRTGTRTVMALPFAEGYHRRHICRDTECGHSFYTLAPYNGGTAKHSPQPFRDRPLTELETDERLGWWTETHAEVMVTQQGNIDPFLQRIDEALGLKEEDRSPVDTLMVSIFTALKQKVAAMEQNAADETRNVNDG